MSASANNVAPPPATKKFGKGERTVPHHSQKAPKYYPAEDVKTAKKVRKSIRSTKYRSSLKPGTILILLAGRFRGKRVILLSPLTDGMLLITGPFKANGVPLRRVNHRYVIATSHSVPLSGLDQSIIKKASAPEYFTKDKAKKQGKSEEAFFKQGEGKPEKKPVRSERAEDQKKVDKVVLAAVRKEKHLLSYLHASFSLRNGDRPHEMKF